MRPGDVGSGRAMCSEQGASGGGESPDLTAAMLSRQGRPGSTASRVMASNPPLLTGGLRGGVDVYSQALKVLAVPLWGDKDGLPATEGLGLGLPAPVRGSQQDRRRKQRGKQALRTREGATGGIKGGGGESSAPAQTLWTHVEDYFRELVAEDIELLRPLSLVEIEGLLYVPPLGQDYREVWREDDKSTRKIGASAREGGVGVKRKLLHASPENKKRKVDEIGAAALWTTVISPQDSDDEEICHVCWGADSEDNNPIMFCDSCDVAVHQLCYGVRQVPEGSWLCAACVVAQPKTLPCVLCPIMGGALKPVENSMVADKELEGKLSHPSPLQQQFAHLFCCQWIPETFVRHAESMEPICNVEGISQERWRLHCSLCRDKKGACIQCAHGLCATAFHALCAMRAKLRMEVSSREGSDQVEMRAYCFKHSSSRVGRELTFSRKIESSGGEDFPEQRSGDSDADERDGPIANEGVSGNSASPVHLNQIEVNASDLLEPAPLGKLNDGEPVDSFPSPVPVSTEVQTAGGSEGDSLENLVSGCRFPENAMPEDKPVDGGPPMDDRDPSDQWRLEVLPLEEQYNAADADNITLRLLAASETADLIELVKEVMTLTHTTQTLVAANSGVSQSMLSMWLSGKERPSQAALNSKLRVYLRGRVSRAPIAEGTSSWPMNQSNASLGRVSAGTSRNNTFLERQFGSFQRGQPDGFLSLPPSTNAFQPEVDLTPTPHKTQTTAQNGIRHIIRDGEARINPSSLVLSTSVTSTSSNPKMKDATGEQPSSVMGEEELPSPLVSNPAQSQHQAASLDRAGVVDQGQEWGEEQTGLVVLGGRPVLTASGSTNVTPAETHIQAVQGRGPILQKSSKAGRRGEVIGDGVEVRRDRKRSRASDGSGGQTQVLSPRGEALEGTSRPITDRQTDKLQKTGSIHPYVRALPLHHGDEALSSPRALFLGVKEAADSSFSSEEHERAKTKSSKASLGTPFHRKAERKHTVKSAGDPYLEFPGRAFTSPECPLCKARFETIPGSEEITLRYLCCQKCEQYLKNEQARLGSISGEQAEAGIDADKQVKRGEMSLLDLAPEDEVQAELLILQSELLFSLHPSRERADGLLHKVLSTLSARRLAELQRQEGAALVAQYMAQLRELKKQGRKDKKDKEAQALLAAATAAAAASPRVGAHIRREGGGGGGAEEAGLTTPSTSDAQGSLFPPPSTPPASAAQLLTSQTAGRSSKPPLPKPPRLQHPPFLPASAPSSKLSVSIPRTGGSGSLAETPSRAYLDDDVVCSICGNGDSEQPNAIVFCERCAVAVHQDCYGIAVVPSGPWLCQPCLQVCRLSATHKPSFPPAKSDSFGHLRPGVQCHICPIRDGAFKRSASGLWAHVFCAQWMPETTVGRDEATFVEGLENIAAERCNLRCVVCESEHGSCLTCNFGHCSANFHPSCARSSGFFMSVKAGSAGRIQFRAYCDRHSPLQRAKAESRLRGGPADMAKLKRCRMEFERLRLICERVVRREKNKRELVHCQRDAITAQLCAAGDPHFKLPMAVAQQTHAMGADSRAVQPDGRKRRRIGRLEDSPGLSFEGDASPGGRSRSSWQGGRSVGGTSRESHLVQTQPRGWQAGTLPVPAGMLGTRGTVTRQIRETQRPQKHTQQQERLMTPVEAGRQNRHLPKGYAYIPLSELPPVARTQELSRNNLPGHSPSPGPGPSPS